MANPFAQLLKLHQPAPPLTERARVVVDGRIVDDVRQVQRDDAEEAARVRAEVRRAKKRAYEQRRMQDPAYRARLAAYRKANRDKLRAYKKAYDERTRGRQRELKSAWQRRDYHERHELHLQRQREYYQRNRERILAKKAAAREAAKLAAATAALTITLE
ncbi:MAG: hypothetical protein KIT60_06845 [Burkholderiaceae bacterium]|nr:hypothetical protein [Burkholderiaceae bacterium]